MTNNEKYLNEAQAHFKKFEAELEPERLREAYMAIENVIPVQEPDPKTRAQLRKNCLVLWLQLVQILDQLVDPRFDPEDVPENLVQPPPTNGGIIYPPGADPALIGDPTARARYEKEIAANQKKTGNYRLQLHLSRLNERIPKRAEAFIKSNYMPARRDQEELRNAIDKMIHNRKRKADLFQLLKPSGP
ncbi:MAG: hypothetical protein ACKV2U_33160 [Bryobacteraceae bacterium]